MLDEIVGPFWHSETVAAHLNLPAGELADDVAKDQIVWAPLADGTSVFPEWQFVADPGVQDKLLTVWRELRKAADPWTAAVWMCSPARELDGQSVVSCLADDPSDSNRSAVVTDLVAADTARWRH
ncbi:hypothetical protein [Tsukamurella ocularis]|uniref:hypothetical protein n=1 Tax=Tsukamurella ocularis TaxID=1970234 RepID=UPI0021675092|nr:hypothetical protein [Tsukamurella ocularis]MCS3779346.1 hypothetical protein [Tsukamurella ocularis]MCS3789928.1 hypothetical protein [Tsukamurella ocularis]MCS3852425.1 hypothetical protein [Tsukamurella ocularis]